MQEDTKISDLTVAEFRKLMRQCLKAHDQEKYITATEGQREMFMRAQQGKQQQCDQIAGAAIRVRFGIT